MPVRWTIHSSEVSTNCSKKALGTTRSGTYEPVPAMPTRILDAMLVEGEAEPRDGAHQPRRVSGSLRVRSVFAMGSSRLRRVAAELRRRVPGKRAAVTPRYPGPHGQ